MSNRYKGAVISATPPTTTGGESGTASGAWTLEQQMQLQAAGLWPSQPPPPSVEDVFSTYLYAGGTTTQTITNGINLSGKGGMVWIKSRASTYNHSIWDSSRAGKYLFANQADAETSAAYVNFLTTGFTVTANDGFGYESPFGGPYVSWAFRKQPKFFDVVTYTGNGVAGREIPHSLGSVPGCIMVKVLNTANNWAVYHQSLGNNKYLSLDLTAAATTSSGAWNLTSPTSTNFTVGTNGDINGNGNTYVAYLFAHDAGGFGLTETDNVISCGGYTGTGAAQTINLGYEPQLIITKRTNTTGDWQIIDNIRGFSDNLNLADKVLNPNLAAAETDQYSAAPGATGIKLLDGDLRFNASGSTYIYIAIRRGPMRVPTDATKVFSPVARNGTNGVATVTTTNLPDSIWSMNRAGATGYPAFFYDRLRGANTFLIDNTSEETYDAANSSRYSVTAFNNLSYALGADANYAGINGLTSGYSNWVLSRAPSFFDEVCWTGSGTSGRSITHNLTVAPTLIIMKNRTTFSFQWSVYQSSIFNVGGKYELVLNSDVAQRDSSNTNDPFSTSTAPTATQFTLGSGSACNSASSTYVAYLFATCAGVSKVGTYNGSGGTQTIDCGFAAGARFVLIKRYNSTGDWYVWDSARGMVSGTDPSLLLNSTAAEVNANSVYAITTGFQIVSTAAGINASGGSYIFLAIA